MTSGDSLAVAVAVARGSGTIVAFGDRSSLSNGEAAGSGMAPLFVRAAAAATRGGGRLVFDEYHHGFRGGSVRAGVLRFLAGHPAGWMSVQAGVLALAALLGAGRRFGAPAPAPRDVRRSPLEHVDALAQVYREAGARRIPRLLLVAGLARQARRPRPLTEEEAVRFLEGLAGPASGAGAELEALEEMLRREEPDVLEVALQVDRVRREVGA